MKYSHIQYDAREVRRQNEKAVAEDEMVRQHHLLNECEFEQTVGDCGRQEPCMLQTMESQESDLIQRLNNSINQE